MVEMSRMAVEHIEGRRVSDESFLSTLLGEAQSTLLGLGAPPVVMRSTQSAAGPIEKLESRRVQEPDALSPRDIDSLDTVDDAPLPEGSRSLDREIRKCVRALAGPRPASRRTLALDDRQRRVGERSATRRANNMPPSV